MSEETEAASDGGTVMNWDEWVPDPDGMPAREAARVLLVNSADEVLLIRGHDRDDPGHRWWFTVGGGIEPGERPVDGAARELAEETGIVLPAESLVGPVGRRSADFRFSARTVRQREEFFFARYDARQVEFARDGWTAIEHETLDEFRWWSVAELRASAEAVYPRDLADLLEALLRDGWDGATPVID